MKLIWLADSELTRSRRKACLQYDTLQLVASNILIWDIFRSYDMHLSSIIIEYRIPSSLYFSPKIIQAQTCQKETSSLPHWDECETTRSNYYNMQRSGAYWKSPTHGKTQALASPLPLLWVLFLNACTEMSHPIQQSLWQSDVCWCHLTKRSSEQSLAAIAWRGLPKHPVPRLEMKSKSQESTRATTQGSNTCTLHTRLFCWCTGSDFIEPPITPIVYDRTSYLYNIPFGIRARLQCTWEWKKARMQLKIAKT